MTFSFTEPRSTCQWRLALFTMSTFFVWGCTSSAPQSPQLEQHSPSAAKTVPSDVKDSKANPITVHIETLEKVCSQDTDCILASQGCCGCNSGGQQDALNKKYSETLKGRRVKGCAHQGCLAVINDSPECQAKQAQCIKGQCEVKVSMQKKIKTMPIE